MSLALPAGIDAHLGAMAALASSLEGHLTAREARFLSLLAAVPTAQGDLLEIGSFKGKSTILLAKSASFAKSGRVVAVDPLNMPSATDPTDADRATLPALFRENLERHAVEALVDFHQTTSGELAPKWNRPLRLLWIDGDHTWAGASLDFDAFARFLGPGAIVAVHDVLNRFDGPLRVVTERMLAGDRFGACGLVGSIGWAQVAVNADRARAWSAAKASLRERLEALAPYVSAPAPWSLMNRMAFKLLRARVPHAEPSPAEWSAAADAAP